jgi:Ca2+-binding EF-hand superfamily protein
MMRSFYTVRRVHTVVDDPVRPLFHPLINWWFKSTLPSIICSMNHGWVSPTSSEEDQIDAQLRVPDDVMPLMLTAKARAATQLKLVAPRPRPRQAGASATTLGRSSFRLKAEDKVPDQIREWMGRNLMRVRDVFLAFDDDDNGKIDRSEFHHALRTLGFDGLEESADALFNSFDVDGSKTIDYRELHHVLLRSVRLHPHLKPMPTRARNAIALRAARLDKRDANLMQGLTLDVASEDEIPDRIRGWMRKNLLRVRDVFAQLDDDDNGIVDRSEFRKALRELGCTAPGASVDAVFKSFDADGSKAIDYRELHDLLVRSVQAHPHLPPLTLKAENSISLRKMRLSKQDAKLLQGLAFDDGDDIDDACTRIRARMRHGLVRVIDIFQQFDDDRSGLISRQEFGKALHEMGCTASRGVIDRVFRSFDSDGNYTIEYKELHSLLGRHS